MTQQPKQHHSKYLLASEQDASWGITISTVGFQRIEPGEHYPLPDHPARYLFSPAKGRVLDEYQLLYICQGSGTFTSDSVAKTELRHGAMFLLFPHEWHNYSPNPETGWEEYWIGFDGSDMDKYLQNGFFDRTHPLFNVGLHNEVVELYREAIRVAEEKQPGYQQLMGGIVHHLLGVAHSYNKRAVFEDESLVEKINQAKIIIEKEFASKLSPENMANRLGMSYSWFRRQFLTYTGLSAKQYIQQIRLREAMNLLTNTSARIKEISFECGYNNIEHFYSAFKKNTGYTPEGYRQFTQGRSLEAPIAQKNLDNRNSNKK